MSPQTAKRGSTLGLIAILGVFHKAYTASLTVEKARPYARWVAARYADVPNGLQGLERLGVDFLRQLPLLGPIKNGLQHDDDHEKEDRRDDADHGGGGDIRVVITHDTLQFSVLSFEF